MDKQWWKSPLYAGIFSDSKTTTVESTGAGEDGKIQPDNPVGMIPTSQGPKMLHEGELKVTDQNGNFSVIPSSQLPQSFLRQIEQESKMGGFESGGVGTQNNWLGTVKTVNPTISNPATPAYNAAPAEYKTIKNANPTSPIEAPASVQNSNQITPLPATPTYDIAPKTTAQPVAPATLPGASDQALSTDIIRQYAQGNGPALRSIMNTQLQDQGATGASAQAALKQNLAMSGAGKDAIQTALAVNQRDQESSEAKLRAGIAQGAMQEQLGAAGTLNTIATNQENTAYTRTWNENDRDYQRTKEQNQITYDRNVAAATTAFNAGDFDTAAKLFQTAMPNANIDFSKLKTAAQQKDFTNAVTNIQSWATTSDMDWDQLEPILEKSGAFKDTGISKDQAKSMVQDIRNQTNPVTAAAATFSDQNIQTLFPTLDKGQYSGLRNELVQLAVFGGTSKDGTIDTSKINETSMPILAKLMGIETTPTESAIPEQSSKESFYGYKLATSDPDTDSYWFEDPKGNMVQFTGAEVSGNTNLSAAAKGSGKAPVTAWAEKSNTYGSDKGNVYGAKPNMFTAGGQVYTSKDAFTPLVPGQKMSFTQNFSVVNDDKNAIPKGNYTVVQSKDGSGSNVNLLQSEDGERYYLPHDRHTLDNGWKVPGNMGVVGYTWDKTGSYLTKNA